MSEQILKIINSNCKKSVTDVSIINELKNNTIFITGGTGFVGKWLSELICYLNTEFKFNIKLYLLARDIEKFKKEVPHLASNNSIVLIKGDVRQLNELPDDINYLIHAAGSPDRIEHINNPLSTLDVFYSGTKSIYEKCTRLNKIKKIIHLSSNYIYGDTNNEYISEDKMGTLENINFYSVYKEVKRISEVICSIYSKLYNLPIVIVRPFAFIGPYQKLDKPWAINNFIRDAINGGPIKILGNEKTIRSYLYGSDLAYALLKLLVKGKNNQSYNLGSSNPISLKQLAEKIKLLFNPKLEIINRFSHEFNNLNSFSVPNLELLKKEIGNFEHFTIDEALTNTINWNVLNLNN